MKNNTYGPAGRYRIHKVLGNTNRTGLWAYRLDTPININKTNYHMKCWRWYYSEPNSTLWDVGLPSCPCLKSQAAKDYNFIPEVLPSISTDLIKTLRRLQGNGTTFQSTLPNGYSAGLRCVYDPEGYLISGFRDRYFIYDPDQRGVQDHIGQVYGTLHFSMFDGQEYTFKGLGEFVIVRLSSAKGANVFTLQGQTEKRQLENGYANTTALVRLAAFYQGTLKVEWRISENRKDLLTLVDDKQVEFKKYVVYFSQNGFSLLKLEEKKVAIVYSCGLQVSVGMGEGAILQAVVLIPQTFLYKTLGLLGLWSTSKGDDFTQSNGLVLSFPENILPNEENLYNFGLSWIVPAPESLFVSKQSMEAWKAFKPTFTSALMTAAAPTALQDANLTCSGLIQCIHDYLMSNSSAMGRQTTKLFNDFKQLVTLYGKNSTISSDVSLVGGKVLL
ncbi:sushi domain-containing protein 2-like [Pyxicephalus adspersus]|uniref:sushi domain-containing protein 2-like n=1 Tax=Pyxicephalus adspersus TaxID=30357 RepID=UPI003B5BE91D